MARSAHTSAKMRPPDMFFSPKRGRILSGQRSESAPGDLVHRPEAGDPAVPGRPLGPRGGPLAVVVDERPGLRAIDLEALAHGLLAVVVALHQHLAGLVVAAVDL